MIDGTAARGITIDQPNLPHLVGTPENLIERAECHLRSIGMQFNDDWRARRALILLELGNVKSDRS